MLRYAPRDIGAVLLDFNMPRFNGTETLQFLRKLSPQVKVLAVSGVKIKELPAEFRDGVERFVPKPFSNDDLLKTLDEILQRNPRWKFRFRARVASQPRPQETQFSQPR